MASHDSRRARHVTLLSVIAILAGGPVAVMGGPNLVAIGSYDEAPFTRAEGRVSHAGKEIVYSFDDPQLDFGRVVVRSDQALSVVKRDLFVGFSGDGLRVDTQAGGSGGSRNQQTRLSQLEIWLRLNGTLRGGRSYEWEFEMAGEQDLREGVPAVIPMLWADGEQIAAEVRVSTPEPEDTDRIQRLLLPHGVVDLPQFDHQTGAAWIVLKPEGFGARFVIRHAAFREIDKDLASEGPSTMPIPVRYIPIRSVLEGQVAEVMDRSVQVLRDLQQADGSWAGPDAEQTAIGTATIAECLAEVDSTWEGLRKAYDWLSAQTAPDNQDWGVAATTARLSALARSGAAKEFDSILRKDVIFLTNAQLPDGGWGDRSAVESFTSRTALRSSHIRTVGALGSLYQARLVGIEADSRVWKNAMQYWTDAQAGGGGFSDRISKYGGLGQIPTSGYTALGASAMIVSIDMAFAMGGRKCSAYTAAGRQLKVADAALRWLDEHYADDFSALGSFVAPDEPLIEPYGMLEVGAASGLWHLDGKDHFRESAAELMGHFDRTTAMFGVRGPNGQFTTAPSALLTAMAIKGLLNGSAPAVCQRIIAGDDAKGWAEFRSDASHLARYLSQKRNRSFNWRRTSIDRDMRELAEVPIMMLSVVGPFSWPKESWDKIREYCLSGGTVVIDIDPDAESERTRVSAAIAAAFPEYKLTEMTPDAPVLSLAGSRLKLAGLKVMGNGFRDFVFLPAESWSCQWHLYQTETTPDSFAFMTNLLQYATDEMPLRSAFEGSPYAQSAASSKKIAAVRLQAGGESPAWPNLLQTMSRLMQSNFRMAVEEVADPSAADVVWLNIADEPVRGDKALAQTLEAARGGTFILIDLIGGNPDWDEAFQAVFKETDGAFSLEKLPRNDAMYTGSIPGTQGLNAVEVRLRKSLHTKFSKTGRCDLYAVLWDGKRVGVYSAHDLSSGVGHNLFPGCRGPMPDDARRVAVNAFLSAYARKLGATTVQ